MLVQPITETPATVAECVELVRFPHALRGSPDYTGFTGFTSRSSAVLLISDRHIEKFLADHGAKSPDQFTAEHGFPWDQGLFDPRHTKQLPAPHTFNLKYYGTNPTDIPLNSPA